MIDFDGPIYQAKMQLNDTIPLYVYLVKGADFAVWIDSGIRSMFPRLVETLNTAGADLRFVLHTHSHHDHIGCDAQLKERTGCLLAAPSHYAAWHSDFERHYQEFARPFPHLVPDTPELREEVLSLLDRPHKLDLMLDEGAIVDLGGVVLEAFRFPGHMLAELGWFEHATRTLILGDAITGLDWPIFHSHLTVDGYRATLARIRDMLSRLQVQQILFAHFPPMEPAAVDELIDQAHTYIDAIETSILRIMAADEQVSLTRLWTQTCERMGRIREFRALNMVYAHVKDLVGRGILREVAPELYTLR